MKKYKSKLFKKNPQTLEEWKAYLYENFIYYNFDYNVEVAAKLLAERS